MSKEKNNLNFLIFILIIIFSAVLEQKLLIFGIGFNFLLASLIILPLFTSYLEITFLSLLGILLINYKPELNIEIIFLFLLPQLIYFISKKFKWENWFASVIFLVCGIILFYFVINFHFIFTFPFYFVYDFIASFIFGMLLFLMLKNLK